MGRLADVRGHILGLSMEGMRIEVQTPLEDYEIETPLIGSFNCENILAAATVAFAYGIETGAVQEALHDLAGVPGRLERVGLPARPDLPGVCVDYAHTPAALQKALTVLRPLVPGQLVCVVGCGGDRDRTKRPEMGRIATELADLTIFTADNSRSERTDDIIAQMLGGIRTANPHCLIEPDRRRAIALAIRHAHGADDMVAVCGRGHEQFQEIAGRRSPLDDRVVAREALEAVPLRRRTA